MDAELGADCVVESSYPPYVDVYAALKKSDGWDATADSGPSTGDSADGASTDVATGATSDLSNEFILRSCVVDLSLDYCTRVSTRVTTDYLDELEKIPEADYPKLSDLDALLANRTDEVEPYCTAFTRMLRGGVQGGELPAGIVSVQERGGMSIRGQLSGCSDKAGVQGGAGFHR